MRDILYCRCYSSDSDTDTEQDSGYDSAEATKSISGNEFGATLGVLHSRGRGKFKVRIYVHGVFRDPY